jgi:hypothetical protein
MHDSSQFQMFQSMTEAMQSHMALQGNKLPQQLLM